jgi:tRNA1(Val) A37 N6-methylase TrmN6
MTPDRPADLTDDAALGARLHLLQPRRGHRFGHDAVLLAAAATPEPGARIVDLGAGVGLAGLALAARVSEVTVTLLERESDLVALAQENIRRNGLVERVRAVALDAKARPAAFAAAGLPPASADTVIMNPPFNDPARQQASPARLRARAHVAGADGLNPWCRAARRLLRPGGTLTLIFRADGLPMLLAALGRGFGGVALRPVHPRPDAPAVRVLAATVKGSRAPPRLLPGLVLNDADGRPSAAAEAVLRDAAALPF